MNARFEELVGNAILGIDTLWGGDVMCESGTGRFIADSWFSDEPLPAAYTHPAAARVRESGGVSAKEPDKEAIRRYLDAVDVSAAIGGLARAGAGFGGLRGAYVANLALCFETMWDLAMELLGEGLPLGDHVRIVETRKIVIPAHEGVDALEGLRRHAASEDVGHPVEPDFGQPLRQRSRRHRRGG